MNDSETRKAILDMIKAEQLGVTDDMTSAFNSVIRHAERIDALLLQLRSLPDPVPTHVDPYTPEVENQLVLNAVGRVATMFRTNLIGLMPNDLLDHMVASRDMVYNGPPVQNWGLTDDQKRLVVEELKKP